MHTLKRRTRGAKGELALKIDISKAYDKVEWSFLKGMLIRMGFSDTWVHWMMLCVSSVNYSALVNFEKVGPIRPGRGLRQGDPLSPYLFIIVAEGLTSLIKKAVASGDLHGIKICRGAPAVSHLLFADDCFLFCRSNLSETRKLMEILKIYEEASGQEINLSKSEVFFSRNISSAAQEDLSNLMGVKHVMGTGTYLGLPSTVGRSKKQTFAFIKDRIWKRINSWRSRPLSRADKEMIKYVLQAIPAYVMNIYLLPDSLINDIERMINAFWWGGGDNNKGIRWLAWNKLTCTKEEGGLGFCDFQKFNMAMVAKQGWKFLNNPNSLVARIFKARYFPRSSFLDSCLGTNPSFIWRSIWKSRQVWLQGCRWSIVPLLHMVEADRVIWSAESNGVYSVRSGYRKLMQESNSTFRQTEGEAWGDLWKVQAPPKAKLLLWRICKDCLPTRTRLRNSYVQCPIECSLCMLEPEEEWHMFFECEGSIDAWSVVGLNHIILPRRHKFNNIRDLLFDICRYENKQVAGKMATLLWCLWQNRNNKVWKNNKLSAQQVGVQAAHMWNEWSVVQGISSEQQSGDQQLVANRPTIQWHNPRFGYVKCNVDASFFNIAGATGWGWCVRDHQGRFIIAGSNIMQARLNILEGEAMAIKEAMIEMIQKGFSHVIIESDSKTVVDAISSSQVGISEFSLLISSIKSLLVSNPNFEVKFVKRQANMTVHALARAAYSMSGRRVFESIPRCIENQLINDMN
ncbi:hypothetical protein TSUD_88120 [Trifolium subterraneum]|uniref:Reverse transcriptase domain-containing protein n=1 Tax=Trifolium subterraneum TaxID=3900 RepID=A0A2Z6PIX2_TRISU|nr:hypothetical protein TSUD_88120 [Trifolium subterraneum]